MRLLPHLPMLMALVAATTASSPHTRAPVAAATDPPSSDNWLNEQRAILERLARSLSPADILGAGFAVVAIAGLLERLGPMGRGVLQRIDRATRNRSVSTRLRIAGRRMQRNVQRVSNVVRGARQLGPELRQWRGEMKGIPDAGPFFRFLAHGT